MGCGFLSSETLGMSLSSFRASVYSVTKTEEGTGRMTAKEPSWFEGGGTGPEKGERRPSASSKHGQVGRCGPAAQTTSKPQAPLPR